MRHSRGFTLVELMVTMAVGGLLVVAAVGMYLTVLGQSPVIKTRNTLSTNLQSALNRINDDVRRSSNVSLYNIEADANAPQNITGYENVPGPDPDTNDQYYWRMGENRLLLNQTPLDSNSNPIYDNAQYAVGKKIQSSTTLITVHCIGVSWRHHMALTLCQPQHVPVWLLEVVPTQI